MKNRIEDILKLTEERKSELYPDVARRFKREVQALSKTFTPSNGESIVSFLEGCFSKGLTIQRMQFYTQRLAVVQGILSKDFKDYTRADVEKVFTELNGKYARRTVEDFKEIIRTFWRWLYKVDADEKAPEPVRWLRSQRVPNNIRPEDLITPAEFRKMLDGTKSLMYKAMLSLLFYTGMRPGELRGVTFADMTENGESIRFRVRGKMRKQQGERTVFLVDKQSIILLKAWVGSHPSGKGYLFVNSKGRPTSQNDLKKLVQRTGERVKLGKRCFPYLFRHSFGTTVYKKHGMLIGQKIMGHGSRSRMADVYVHLGEEDVLEAMLGKKPPEDNGQIVDAVVEKSSEEQEFLKFMGWLSGQVDLQAKFKEWKENFGTVGV